jgi:fibronectin-binding autotransporter adhesin
MKPKYRRTGALVSLFTVVVFSTAAHSADVFWDGGTVDIPTDGNGASGGTAGTWNTSLLNWDVGASPHVAWNNANNDTAVFAGTAGVVTLGSDVTVGGLTFNTNTYSVAPGGFGITFGAPGNISVSTGTSTISAPISGSAITKTGAGTLILGGANTFTGLDLDGGRVSLGTTADSLGAAGSTITLLSNTILGNSVNGAITLDKSLAVNTGTLTFVHSSSSFTIQGVVSGSGTIKPNDAGSVFQRTLNLTNTANTFTGAIDLLFSRSAISVGSLSDASGSGNVIFGANSSGFQLGTTAITDMTLANRIFEFRGGTSIGVINNVNTTAANTLTVGSNLSVTTAGAKTLQLGGANTGANAFTGVIADGSGTVTLIKADAGTWALSGANTYTGATSVLSGTLSVNSIASYGIASALGAPSSGVLPLVNATLEYTGSGHTSDRQFRVGNTNQAGGSGTILNNGTGALIFSAADFNISDPTTGGSNGNRILTLGGSYTGGINEIQGAIVANAFAGRDNRIIKTGDGSWMLSGTNTYTGTTTVSGGTLIINGNSSTATGAVTVAAGATLGGSGTIGGNTTINGTITPGNSPGVLAFGGTLALAGASGTVMEINGSTRGTGYDGVDVTGAITYGGALTLDLGMIFGGGSHTFNLFDFASQTGSFSTVALADAYTGSLTNDGSGVWGLVDGDNTWSFEQSTGDLNLSVIPEPSTALLGALGLLALLRRRR